MDNRRDEYLNLVLNILLEDSIISHSNRNWWLESPWIQNSPWIQDNGIVTPHVGLFKYMLPYTLNSTSDPFGKYCRDNYGLTDQEIYDMWRIYHDEMWKRYYKLSSGKLNESVDRRSEYLDKIVNYLVDDTTFDFKNDEVYFSSKLVSHSISRFMALLLKKSFDTEIPYISKFIIYCEDTYGLSEKDTKLVWNKYKKILLNKINNESSINESVDRKDDYLNKVLNYLVDDTKVDQKNKTWYPPFPTPHPHPMFKTFYNLIPMAEMVSPRFLMENSYVRYFFNYCSDTYGLSDFNEIQKLWLNYLYALEPKITGFTINESVDRKQDFLDKVVDFLVDDTKLDDKEEELTLSLGSAGFKIIYFSDFLWATARFPYDIPLYFSEYCKNTYGLTDEEIRYVWAQHRYIIRDKILSIMKNKYRSNNINESVDRKQDYLDKIVDFMLNDTRYSVYTNRYNRNSKVDVDIWFPSDPNEGYTYNMYDIYEWSIGDGWNLDEGGDVDYICNTYSICDRGSIQEMYNRYIQKLSTIIYDEMLEVERRNDSINESVDRRSEYLDKIVNYLVDDTKIEDVSKRWNPPFMSIWLERSRLFSHDVPHAGIFHRFYEYCKETYGLSDDEMMGVWNKYTKSLIYKLRDF